MAQLLIHNARVVLEHGTQDGGVLVRDERIAQVFKNEQMPAGLSASESIDLGGAYLAPGLIDIHIHGSAGVDAQATDEDGLAKLSKFLLTEGVTGYFPTMVPTDERGYNDALTTIGSYIDRKKTDSGARILGIHFEGPFVSEHRCGALQPRHFRTYDGDPQSIELFTATSVPRLMTLAPEIERGLELTRELTAKGVRVFIGHSQAEIETLDLAAEAGARHITHFPNALEPLHHRKPGAVAWGLVRQDVTLDCIADFHHVHPMMLRLMYKSKGAVGMALISDAIRPAGLGDGEFSVWGEKITVRNGRTALVDDHAEGTIAGSVITMRQAVRNMAGVGVPLHEAVRMASLSAATAAGINNEYGSIEPGKCADLIAFNESFAVRIVIVGGELRP